jgi:hypothetical protein
VAKRLLRGRRRLYEMAGTLAGASDDEPPAAARAVS